MCNFISCCRPADRQMHKSELFTEQDKMFLMPHQFWRFCLRLKQIRWTTSRAVMVTNISSGVWVLGLFFLHFIVRETCWAQHYDGCFSWQISRMDETTVEFFFFFFLKWTFSWIFIPTWSCAAAHQADRNRVTSCIRPLGNSNYFGNPTQQKMT